MRSVKVSKLVSFGLAFVCCLSLVPAIQADTMVTVPNGDFSSPNDGGTYHDNWVPTDWTFQAPAAHMVGWKVVARRSFTSI